jgi:hypothetical protein
VNGMLRRRARLDRLVFHHRYHRTQGQHPREASGAQGGWYADRYVLVLFFPPTLTSLHLPNVKLTVPAALSHPSPVRMNFSHGSYEYHQSVIDNTRAAVKANPTGRPLAIALDTKGPEIRTGLMTNDTDVKIEAGHEFWVTTNPEYAEKGSAEYMYVDYVSTPSSFPDLMGWRL